MNRGEAADAGGEAEDPARAAALDAYVRVLTQTREKESEARELRLQIRQLEAEAAQKQEQAMALLMCGQTIGTVERQLEDEVFIVKARRGTRFVVGVRRSVDPSLLLEGTRVALDVVTNTIMRALPRETDPTVYRIMAEDVDEKLDFGSVGGLEEAVRELREVIELPIKHPELFTRVGIKPPKGVLLYGPPGTGKTLLARVVAATCGVKFLKIVASSIVDKYIGESARLVREIFAYARQEAPCIIFIDEIDAIGGSRGRGHSSTDREVKRTLLELLQQLDGFKPLDKVKIIFATNRPDVLDKALLRPGRIDRKIEIPLPNVQGRLAILRIHSRRITVRGPIGTFLFAIRPALLLFPLISILLVTLPSPRTLAHGLGLHILYFWIIELLSCPWVRI